MDEGAQRLNPITLPELWPKQQWTAEVVGRRLEPTLQVTRRAILRVQLHRSLNRSPGKAADHLTPTALVPQRPGRSRSPRPVESGFATADPVAGRRRVDPIDVGAALS